MGRSGDVTSADSRTRDPISYSDEDVSFSSDHRGAAPDGASDWCIGGEVCSEASITGFPFDGSVGRAVMGR